MNPNQRIRHPLVQCWVCGKDHFAVRSPFHPRFLTFGPDTRFDVPGGEMLVFARSEWERAPQICSLLCALIMLVDRPMPSGVNERTLADMIRNGGRYGL